MHLPRPHRRHALTLLEMIVAMAIFLTLITALLSSWAATTDYAYMVNQSLRRMETVDALRKTVAGDFAQSTWLYQFNSTTNLPMPDTAGNDIILYPSTNITGQNGREIRFARFRTSLQVNADPLRETPYTENLLRTPATALSAFATSAGSPMMLLNPGAEGRPGEWNLSPIWESHQTKLTFAQNADPANLRLYRYILVPYALAVPSTIADTTVYGATDYPTYASAMHAPPYTAYEQNLRRGMLLRQYHNSGTTAWTTLGAALCDQVVFYDTNTETDTAPDHPYFVFSTVRDTWITTRSGLAIPGVYEVRLRLTLAVPTKQAGPPGLFEVQLSLPMQIVDYGT